MWGAYHRLRTSRTFLDDWHTFLSVSIGCRALPTFCQFITNSIFKKLIKIEYVVNSVSPELPSRDLTQIEQNALRYVARYVLQKLQNQLETASHPKM